MSPNIDVQDLLLNGLNQKQRYAVKAPHRRLLVIAGAGSGKTEVMARRIAWWVAVKHVAKDKIIAFTFTERAAEEMKFRIRHYIQLVTPEGEDVTLGGMYVGTMHGFCLKLLRELRPDEYRNYDVIDEGARLSLVQRGFHFMLGLSRFQSALGVGQFQAIDQFLRAYDLLNEYASLKVKLPAAGPPHRLEDEADWCKNAELTTNVGASEVAEAFALSAARFYAYLRCRRFLDFSTSQSELLRLLKSGSASLKELRQTFTHLVVDEVQDINPVQDKIIRAIIGDTGHLTAVGDHRQAIYRFRGSRVELMAEFSKELAKRSDSKIRDLTENYRSTSRIINLANAWARTISPILGMPSPDMDHGNHKRDDLHTTHVASLSFPNRRAEADWIARTIKGFLKPTPEQGAYHDTRDNDRGLAYGDIAVLLRSSTDARLYMTALQRQKIPAVFRAGPDLFSQPEVLLFLGALARLAGVDQFYGGPQASSLPNRIQGALNCDANPEAVVKAACRRLRQDGLPLPPNASERLLLATALIHKRMTGGEPSPSKVQKLDTPGLVAWLSKGGKIRRIFPQTLFHYLLAEAGIAYWDSADARAGTAMFHVGQLSSLVKGIETPGWNRPNDLKYQIIALCMWGTSSARAAEAPLLVAPDAVTISTVHAAKGLEFAAVFLADVAARRFPSVYARRRESLPFDGPISKRISPAQLTDNDNYDDERRLMYVALTRAERYLFVTHGATQTSRFFRDVTSHIASVGGTTTARADAVPAGVPHRATKYRSDIRLVTSFSDLRYYLQCPHDFYLRKVLGFAPTIDQAFGYGRGVHNIMRAIHTDPEAWAELASDRNLLERQIENLIEKGLFYLRYTTGEPLENMQKKAVKIVADYVERYSQELKTLEFVPEKEFESLIEEEQVLVSGAIDVIRLDNPPRVTLIDFKSGHPESDVAMKLDENEMALQVSIYGLAAKHELEYEPERGLVRYLDASRGENRELCIDLTQGSLDSARHTVVETARAIRDRQFHRGPRVEPRDPKVKTRCAQCDFVSFCDREEARAFRRSRQKR